MELIAQAATVRQFLAYLDHVGFDERALKVGGLDPALRASAAPMAVSARLILDLMEAAAAARRQPDIGVRFAEWLDPRSVSPLSLLGAHCATFAERFRLAQRYVHTHNNARSFERRYEGDDVAIICGMHPALRPYARQYTETIVGKSIKNARAMLGAGWAPVRVEFAHAPPPSIAVHKRLFRCPIHYEADRDAILMSRTDFNRRLPSGDTQIIVFLEKHLSGQEAQWPTDLRQQVENLIAAQLAGGGASLERIAGLLAMSSRTLQRRLAEQGTDFGQILAFVRVQVVKDHLAQRPPPSLDRLCHLLGYSEPSAASRFIKTQFGRSARSMIGEGSPERGHPARIKAKASAFA